MAKKLKVEVDIETEKAKQKLRRDLGSSVEGSSVGAEISDKTAKSLKKLGDEADKTGVNMTRVVRAFSGIAVGMAAKYAANNMEEGAARTAVGYAGSMLQGASMGAMVAGPWGAAAGAALGAGQQWLENDGAQKKMSSDFEKAEQIYKYAKEWNEKLRSLTEVMDPKALEEIISNLKAREEELASHVRENISAGKLEAATESQRALAEVRQRLSQAENLQHNYEKKGAPREGMGATDAISRIGGGFTLGTDVNIQREMKMGIMDCAAYLKRISQQKEGSTWQ